MLVRALERSDRLDGNLRLNCLAARTVFHPEHQPDPRDCVGRN